MMSLTTIEGASEYMSGHEQCPGRPLSINEQQGGFTSYTYRLVTSSGVYFLKHTADHKKGAPHLYNNPNDLFDETKAYEVLGKYMSSMALPHLVFVDDKRYAFLNTDALPGTVSTLKEIVHEQRWPLGAAAQVGYHIGKMHGDAFSDQPTIRASDKEDKHFNRLVRWLTSDLTFNTEATQELIEAKSIERTLGKKTLLMGDLAPRNVIANNEEIALVDIARATLGSPSFDVGYFAGHILLNAIEFEQLPQANRFLDLFRSGYEGGLGKSKSPEDLSPDIIFEESKIFAAGWMHRRTFQPHQPEDIPDHELLMVDDYINMLVANDSFGY